MALQIVRRIRGNVHGSIDVSVLEDLVIGHSYFQRLRRIKQLAFLHYVFPGATHTRFEHSLGVLHLVRIAWDKLRVNQSRLLQSLVEGTTPPNPERMVHGKIIDSRQFLENVLYSDTIFQSIRLAALLHDVGHSVFSHSGETFFPTYLEIYEENKNAVSPYLEKFLKEKASEEPHVKIRHEILSILLIDNILVNIYRKNPHLPVKPDPRDVVAIIYPDIQPEANSALRLSKSLYFCHELISGELDLDRMDYLLRDSKECGVVYGVFDVGRILDSLNAYEDMDSGNFHVAIGLSGLSAFEDYLRARFSMYLQLYFHKTAVSAEAMLRFIKFYLRDWKFPSNLKDYMKLDEYSFLEHINNIAKNSLNEVNLELFQGHLNKLLLDRNLWKRVYEITSSLKKDISKDLIYLVEQTLLGLGYHYLTISSENDLTRLRPRSKYQKSRNYLKLIKKNELQIPIVVPIEDYSRIVENNDTTKIWRVYVDLSGEADQATALTKLKNKIATEIEKNPIFFK